MNDADEDDDDIEADWNEDDLEAETTWPDEEPTTDEEPAWKQWKRNIRAYAESVAPDLPPSAQ